MRLIDADAIKIKPVYMHDICGVVMIRVEDIARILNDMPTISLEPERKMGKWMDRRYKIGYHCSECGGYVVSGKENFCPYCGAKMEGGKRPEYDEFVLCDAKMEGEEDD